MKPSAIAAISGILALAAVRLSAQPVITTQPTNQAVLVGSNATFSVVVSGTGPFTYQWQLNGTNLPNDVIITVAGNGNSGFSGDGGPATNAGLFSPRGAALDGSGNLFIADRSNYRIRKVDINGVIVTVAGNGSTGYSGDGGPATNASLSDPARVAVDSFGNLFIADTNHSRIRKVDTNGIITTVAGNGISGYSGDGGAATNASLNFPAGAAVDSFGNLFIADQLNNRIREVDTNGIITTVAGNGISGYSGDGGAATNADLDIPVSAAVDSFGNLFIAEPRYNHIRKVDTKGIISTLAGNGSFGYSGDGGSARYASFFYISGVAVDPSGNLFIADTDNFRIRRVDTNGIINTVAGKGTVGFSGDAGAATNAGIAYPNGVALDTVGNLFIADAGNNRVREVLFFSGYPMLTLNNVAANNAGDYTVIITGPSGSVTSSVATLTILSPLVVSQPQSLIVSNGAQVSFSVAASGALPLYFQWQKNGTNLIDGGNVFGSITTNLVLSTTSSNDAGSYTIIVTNAYGSVTSRVATLAVVLFPPTGPTNQTVMAGSNMTFSVAVSGTGPFNYQWQLNGTNLPKVITTVAGNGTQGSSGDGGPATNASLSDAEGIAVDAAGNVFIADKYSNRIRKAGIDGIITTVLGDGDVVLNWPEGVRFDALGNMLVADTYNNRILKMGTNGIITTLAGNGIHGYAGDGGPATNASLKEPVAVALDTFGNLFIADQQNHRIRKVNTSGSITTVAGNGIGTYSGDGGAATNGSLNQPSGVALDAFGNLFIGDSYNKRVRKVDTNGIITTIAGNGISGHSGDGGAATNANLSAPCGLAFDASGNLLIGDAGGYRVRRVDTSGIITTVAGGGPSLGDGGAPTNASLYYPHDVAFDTSGNLFIADAFNDRIRKVSGLPTLALQNVAPGNSGTYTVTVNSPFGSVTETIAVLTVVGPPNILGFGQTNGLFNFTWATVSNFNYQVQYTTNLATPNWTNLLASPITATSGVLSASDSITDVQRFYRVVLLP